MTVELSYLFVFNLASSVVPGRSWKSDKLLKEQQKSLNPQVSHCWREGLM